MGAYIYTDRFSLPDFLGRRIVGYFICSLMLILGAVHSPLSMAQISSQDIYDTPDDHALNLVYAKQQIMKGELLDMQKAVVGWRRNPAIWQGD